MLDPHLAQFAGFTAVYASVILAVSTLVWIDPQHDRLLVPLVSRMILALLWITDRIWDDKHPRGTARGASLAMLVVLLVLVPALRTIPATATVARQGAAGTPTRPGRTRPSCGTLGCSRTTDLCER